MTLFVSLFLLFFFQHVENVCLTFQAISFPGLDESEVAHFLCGLQRLNKIAEVQM